MLLGIDQQKVFNPRGMNTSLVLIIGHMRFSNVISFVQNEHEQMGFSDFTSLRHTAKQANLHESDLCYHHYQKTYLDIPKQDTLRSCKSVTECHAVRLAHELDPQQ